MINKAILLRLIALKQKESALQKTIHNNNGNEEVKERLFKNLIKITKEIESLQSQKENQD